MLMYIYIDSPSQWWTFRATNPEGFVSIAHDLLPIPLAKSVVLARAACFCFVSSCDCCWGMTRHAKLTAHVSSLEWYMLICRDRWRYMLIYTCIYILVHDDFSCSLQLLKVRWPKLFFQLMVPCGSQILQLWASPPSSRKPPCSEPVKWSERVGEMSSMWIPNHILPEMFRNGWKWWVWGENSWKKRFNGFLLTCLTWLAFTHTFFNGLLYLVGSCYDEIRPEVALLESEKNDDFQHPTLEDYWFHTMFHACGSTTKSL